MVSRTRTGRPRDKKKVVHSPIDGSILPHCRFDAQGNHFFSIKNKEGKWIKRNLGRGDDWYSNYLKREAEFVKEETYTNLAKKSGQESLLGDISFNTTEEELGKFFKGGFSKKDIINFFKKMNIKDVNIPDSWIYAKARELIKKNPKTASKQLGIPYERLLGLQDTINYSLKKIGDNYFNKPKFLNLDKIKRRDKEKLKELDKIRKSWDWFTKVVGVKTIKEIDKEQHIKKWYDTVYDKYLKNELSITWINGFFERPKRVLNSAVVDFNYTVDITNVSNWYKSKCGKVKGANKKLPKMITPKHLKLILEVSNIEEKAMWLLTLNCGYYGVDVVFLTLDMIDYNDKTIVDIREKTGEYRCAYLWDNTIQAIQDYLSETKNRNRDHNYVFSSVYGEPYVADRMRKKFSPILKKVNLTQYEYSHLRDSFQTSAMIQNANSDMIDIVMGHVLSGSKKDYADKIVAYPKLAKDTCMLVHDYYFPPKKASVKS